jgi:hypothetical protein
MKTPRSAGTASQSNSVLWRLLTLEQLMTGSLVHLVYWFGLGVISLGGFAAIGGGVGLFLREGPLMGLVAAVPVAVAGLLVTAALAIIWRSFCEFYVVVLQIGEDLRALRNAGTLTVSAPAAPVEPAEEAPSARRRRSLADRNQ